jgi:hypothetical protein
MPPERPLTYVLINNAKGKHKWSQPRGESTEVEHWGGTIRMSVEGSVMELEQRDRVRCCI